MKVHNPLESSGLFLSLVHLADTSHGFDYQEARKVLGDSSVC